MQPEMIPLTLIDRAALEHLKSKNLQGSFSHYDVWLDQHKYAFTVAKMMNADMLAEVRSAIADALENGTGFADFQKRLKPYLMARGWWGESVMLDPLDGEEKTVQLGSTRRLRTIFETNMATAHAASRWQRIQASKRGLPYLRYNGSHAHHPRETHKRYYGLVLPVEHPIWQQIFPPNGYGCKCSVTQLTRGQAEREGISEEPNFEFVEVQNPRTGDVVKVPKDITPSFAHNHTKRVDAVLDLVGERHGMAFEASVTEQLSRYINVRSNMDFPNLKLARFAEKAQMSDPELFASSERIIAEGKAITQKYAEILRHYRDIGKPHHGVMEVMQREGVELAGKLDVKGSDYELKWELAQAIQFYPKDWVERSNQLGGILVEGAKGRAFQSFADPENFDSFVEYIMSNKRYQPFLSSVKKGVLQEGDSLILANLYKNEWLDRQSTYIHEFAHRLQFAMPELQDVFLRLFLERTRGDKIEKLNDILGRKKWRDNEKGMRDDFPEPYYGKIYDTENSQNPLPYELMAKIFEALLGGNVKEFKILTSRPELFYFGLALLVRWRA